MNYLSEFQSFATKEELNQAVFSHKDHHRSQLNDTDQKVLIMLSQYAVKFPGVAHLKLSTIAEAINKSERTVRRSLEKLAHLNIIERQPFLREKTGGHGANIYIFLPFKRTGRSSTTKIELRKIEIIHGTCLEQPSHQEPITHYTRFKNLIESYTGENNADFASKLYGIYRTHSIRLMKFSIHENKGEVFETLALQAISTLFRASKKKTIHNLIGYYDGIFRGLIDKTLFSEAFMDYDTPVEIKIIGFKKGA
jgi:predicted transcriptional regulator